MEKNKVAIAIVNSVFGETQRVKNAITNISDLEVTAILTGLTAFFIAGFRNDFDLCQELTPVFQKRIMPSVNKEEYDRLTYVLNDSYVKFRETAIRLQGTSADWEAKMMEEYTVMLLGMLKGVVSDSSKASMNAEVKRLLEIACDTNEKTQIGKPENTERQGCKLFGKISISLAISMGVILLLMAFSIVMIVIYNRLTAENAQNILTIGKLESEYASLDGSYNEALDQIKNLESGKQSLESTNKALTNRVSNLVSQVEDLQQEVRKYENLGTLLNSAQTSNGIISVSSKAYAVKRGSSETIKINWPSYYTTMYMGTNNANIAVAEWTNTSNSNVIVTGMSEGVTRINFSSDETGKKNRFSIVIICYE